MAREMQFGVGRDEADIAVETAAGVPAGVFGASGVGAHGDHVITLEVDQRGNVGLNAEVVLIGPADTLAVDVDIARQHYSLEVEEHTAVFPCGIGLEGFAIPSGTHFLEAAGA